MWYMMCIRGPRTRYLPDRYSAPGVCSRSAYITVRLRFLWCLHHGLTRCQERR
jgi:hypothetical protein